jgi:hypothetical protein
MRSSRPLHKGPARTPRAKRVPNQSSEPKDRTDPDLGEPWTAPTLEHTTPCRLKACPRCGTGDLLWEPDRYVPGREPGAYGCLQCGQTA